MLHKFERFNLRLSGWFEWIALAAMLLIMVITCLDVIGSKIFKTPIFGALDIVMLAQIVVISFAAGITLIAGRHIKVESFFYYLPQRSHAVFNSIVPLIGFILFVIIIWRLCLLGYSFQASGEYSMTAYIPYYPFAYGMALACVPVCLALLLEFLKSLTKSGEK